MWSVGALLVVRIVEPVSWLVGVKVGRLKGWLFRVGWYNGWLVLVEQGSRGGVGDGSGEGCGGDECRS